MKHGEPMFNQRMDEYFSALGRAVWDETLCRLDERTRHPDFSALGRAVWDETLPSGMMRYEAPKFQCSRSSRMG